MSRTFFLECCEVKYSKYRCCGKPQSINQIQAIFCLAFCEKADGRKSEKKIEKTMLAFILFFFLKNRFVV
jgi:hypothetical protein